MLFTRPLRLALRLLALLAVVALAVPFVVAARVWWVGRQDDPRASDVILVLGTAQFDGDPSEIFQSRLEHAHDLYDEGYAPRIVTVGGSQPGDRFTEAEAARGFLVDAGVPAEDLVAVGEGSDTLGSVEAVRDVMEQQGWTSALVVTDPWHTLRTVTMVEDAGIEAAASPAPDGPTYGAEVVPHYLVRETGALMFYRLRSLL